MKTIYLIGFMGCGKSTIGSHLSEQTNETYIDTDTYIEDLYEKEISEIFQESGEEVFRTYEIEALKNVSTYSIVSTGGGIVKKPENLNTMKTNGITIYLQTSFNEIIERLENDDSRPLWDSNLTDNMNVLYERRILLYEAHADYIIDTGNKTVEEITKEIEEIMEVN